MIRTFEIPEDYMKALHDTYTKVKFHDFRINYDTRNFEKQKDYADCFGNLGSAFSNALEFRYTILNKTTNTIFGLVDSSILLVPEDGDVAYDDIFRDRMEKLFARMRMR